ncbi:NAD(P)-binding protein [Aureobasidium subglaciale]|nr:NAD(P)-binding protein [Aureobasidium subglaciale]
MSAIPLGSQVLVTGANGFLASHVIDQLLSAGYRVRGTVRSVAKGQWLVDYFTNAYGPDRFELAVVSDISLPSAFEGAMAGVSGIAHVASDTTFSPNVEEVVPPVQRAIQSILESAAKIPEIDRFVLTSSSVAALYPAPGQRINVTSDSWNDYSLEQAYKTDEAGRQDRAFHVYSASKVVAERALWDFMQQQKPKFVANAVLPDFISGNIIGRQWGQQGSTGGLIVDLFAEAGEKQEAAIAMLNMLPPQWMVDVVDVARLHVAALTDVDIASERIFAFSEVYSYNDVLDAFSKARPDHELPARSDKNDHTANTIAGRDRAEGILQKNFARRFKTLVESVAESIEAF